MRRPARKNPLVLAAALGLVVITLAPAVWGVGAAVGLVPGFDVGDDGGAEPEGDPAAIPASVAYGSTATDAIDRLQRGGQAAFIGATLTGFTGPVALVALLMVWLNRRGSIHRETAAMALIGAAIFVFLVSRIYPIAGSSTWLVTGAWLAFAICAVYTTKRARTEVPWRHT
jgi:hypothetical protein